MLVLVHCFVGHIDLYQWGFQLFLNKFRFVFFSCTFIAIDHRPPNTQNTQLDSSAFSERGSFYSAIKAPTSHNKRNNFQ